MTSTARMFFAIGLIVCAPVAAAAPDEAPAIQVYVDLSEATGRIFHSHLSLPVAEGPLTLLYPKWIPGEHGPTGPISDLAGIRMSAAGQVLAWSRDPRDMYTFHVEVPRGATMLEVDLDYLSPGEVGAFTTGPATSDRLAVLSWNTVLLYPAGWPSDDLRYRPSLSLPDGWTFGTALIEAGRRDAEIEFEPVSLTTLVDSPVAAGAHVRMLDLGEVDQAPHRLNIVADSDEALAIRPEQLAAFRQLITEAQALFGARHYRHYDFLLTLSDHVESFGLEHHESSDNRLPERALLDDELVRGRAGLLPHEFVHSWNAKYRRPAGLATPDYQTPMVDDLLWVYEGLTSYLGTVLTARSGLWSPEYTREYLAGIAARLSEEPGRRWRPLGDTTRAAQVLYGARPEFAAWRRDTDFYDEGVLIWLEADTIIRRESKGRRSLDDFCRLFHGGESGPPEVRPFTREELVADLNRIARYDWERFFADRIDRVRAEAPLGGLENSGWELVYSTEPNARFADDEKARNAVDVRYALGFQLHAKDGAADHGKVLDVIPGSPAANAGLAPGMTLVAVNGRRWSADVLRAALRAAQESSKPIELLIENSGYYRALAVDYHGGERYPHLARKPGGADLLSGILASRAPGSGN